MHSPWMMSSKEYLSNKIHLHFAFPIRELIADFLQNANTIKSIKPPNNAMLKPNSRFFLNKKCLILKLKSEFVMFGQSQPKSYGKCRKETQEVSWLFFFSEKIVVKTFFSLFLITCIPPPLFHLWTKGSGVKILGFQSQKCDSIAPCS